MSTDSEVLVITEIASAVASSAAFLSNVTIAGKPVGIPVGRLQGARHVSRNRLDVESHISTMSPLLFRRRYRMDKKSFFDLFDMLEGFLPVDDR